jgi:predicted enzyme related to lactoylglutathione lyase
MTSAMSTMIYPVKDLAQAKAVYGALLGVEPEMDEAYYVGFNAGGQQIGLDPNGHRTGMTGPVNYWTVEDIEDSLKQLVAAGAQLQQGPHDVGGGKLTATVSDPDGNVVGLIQLP